MSVRFNRQRLGAVLLSAAMSVYSTRKSARQIPLKHIGGRSALICALYTSAL